MMKKRRLLIGIILTVAAAAITLNQAADNDPRVEMGASLASVVDQPSGFQQADKMKQLSFPADYGPHPDFQTEWWYYTGNLETDTGRHFGYQLTFFRRALVPSDERQIRDSTWASDQVYMAHFAISDTSSGEHYAYERFARGAAGLAGADSEPFQVWLENWQVQQVDSDQYHLGAQQDGIEIDLLLQDQKSPILHGDHGYSQKGAQAGNASHYFSQTRLVSSGEIVINGEQFLVEGLSWMDHEFSTSALSPGQIGWDWFSIQLDEDRELMLFQIRRADGSIDPNSSGTLIDPEGSTHSLEVEDFNIQTGRTWRSPNTSAEYPVEWEIQIPEYDLDLSLKPYLLDQELDLSFTYWEGAVEVSGTYRGRSIQGRGFVEMTGYAASMEGEF
jgi:predicted secreted hydrolase